MNASLLSAVRATSDALANLVSSLKLAGKDATNSAVQEKLVLTSQETSVVAMDLVATTKRLLPRIPELAVKQELKMAGDRVQEDLQKLMNACKSLTQEEGGDITEIMDSIAATLADLDTTSFAIQSGVLRPAPGQTREDALALLNLATKQLSHTNEKMKAVAKTSPKQGKLLSIAQNLEF